MNFLWDAEFSLIQSLKSAARGEVYIAGGCLARVVSSLVQVLYALNEIYFIGDKQVYYDLQNFKLTPGNFLSRIEAIISHVGKGTPELMESTKDMKTLIEEIKLLTRDLYHPK